MLLKVLLPFYYHHIAKYSFNLQFIGWSATIYQWRWCQDEGKRWGSTSRRRRSTIKRGIRSSRNLSCLLHSALDRYLEWAAAGHKINLQQQQEMMEDEMQIWRGGLDCWAVIFNQWVNYKLLPWKIDRVISRKRKVKKCIGRMSTKPPPISFTEKPFNRL